MGSSATLLSEIETSIARIIEINQADARRAVADIGGAHKSGIVVDLALGIVTLSMALAVGAILVRTLRRQRELLRQHLENLDARQRELAAFASRTAHDMRGPLSPLRGYADLLQLHSEPAVQDNGRRIARAADRMAGIIEDMLELSVHGKPAGGKVAVAPVVREVLDDLRRELADADVITDVDDVLTACSAGVLGQIVRNLVGNSAKYRSPQRKLALRVEAHRAGDRVELAVSDNGIGMDAEDAEHAFDPMYRAPSASSPGHGLGLSIVKRTVDSIGGSVALASKPGDGTRVTVRMPAA
jgi:signal transduction histidine kinase